MSPAWWVTYLSIALNLVNAAWFTWLGLYTGTTYWLCAAILTICAMKGLQYR
jgi:hypothetical protein